MATTPQTTTHRNLTPNRSHRRAFGRQRPTTPAQRAQFVAESMQAHGLDIDDPATWTRYGLAEASLQGQLVIHALCNMAPRRGEPLLDQA